MLVGLAIVGLAIGAGCGDGLGRRAVSGQVLLDSEPLAEGVILFEPSTAGEAGTAVGGPIRSGRFSIPRRDGPVPGSYTVRIYASSGEQAPAPPGTSPRAPRPMVDLIPDRYNAKSELAATVTPDGRQRYRFELHSDPSPSPSGD
jgi:hypothetical protein